jgi:3-methyladenine DNA glycosylase Mpg
MRVLNISDDISDSDLMNKVRRFVYNNQYSLPVSIMNTSHIVIMLLEEGDFRFIIEGDSITVTE